MQVLFISWSVYFTTIAIALIFYYMVIGYLYYRKEIITAFNNNVQFNSVTGNPLKHIPGEVKENNQTDISANIPLQVQSFTDEVKACLQEAGSNDYTKEDILNLLQRLVLKYPFIKDSVYKLSLEQFIINECETHCAVSFSEEEVSVIW